MSASSQTMSVFHELVREFYSRKLLLQPPSSSSSPPPTASYSENSHTGGEPYGENGFEANVVMVLSVLLCALVCSLGLNSIVRCALRCSLLVATQSSSKHLDTECAICLSEFAQGERVRVLPKCSHGFHVRCIDTWLTSHSSCPTCRYSLIETCKKKTSSTESSSSGIPLPQPTPSSSVAQETIVSITPLNREPIVNSSQACR